MLNRITAILAVTLFGCMVTTLPAQAVEFGAFADVNLSGSDAAGENTSFNLGALDLYATQDIGDKTTAFIEYVFEDADGFVIDLERLWLKRAINDRLSLGVGRFHSPLGYWNRTYHHGILIQDTVSRPSFIDFEDGEGALLPMHVIGLMASGETRTGGGTFGYEFVVGNSSSLDSTASANASTPGAGLEIGVSNVSDLTDDKSIVARGRYAFNNLPLEIGVFGAAISYVEGALVGDANFGSLAQGEELVSQTVFGFDLRYRRGPFDLHTEYFGIDNSSDVGVGSDTGTAYFIQGGWQAAEKVKLVYRFESVDVETATDTYFNILNTAKGDRHVGVLRYDLDDSNALMFELNSTDPDVGDGVTAWTLDWAFLLF